MSAFVGGRYPHVVLQLPREEQVEVTGELSGAGGVTGGHSHKAMKVLPKVEGLAHAVHALGYAMEAIGKVWLNAFNRSSSSSAWPGVLLLRANAIC